MAKIELQNLTKKYKNTIALNNINLKINDKEFFVLFGPAGAGKTTLLKMIAGIEYADEGNVLINDKVVNVVEATKRNIAMVFENYALYPHLSVYDNIASPLRSKLYKKSEKEINVIINDITKTLNINKLLERLPSQLSNGQRQRVALGRCLVRNPNAFLMDEPLAHLDAKLRHFMRTELKSLQTKLDSTVVYVTHDYLEALGLSDRLAIINEGSILQVGTSKEIYYTPINEFVAKLVGEPEINILNGKVNFENSHVTISQVDKCFMLDNDVLEMLKEKGHENVHIGLRSNAIDYSLNKENDHMIECKVYNVEPSGNRVVITLEIKEIMISISVPNTFRVDIDQTMYVKFNMNEAMFFQTKNGEFITRHNIDKVVKGGA